MTKTTHASIIALLLCSSFSIYGSAATNFSDNTLNNNSAAATHNQTNAELHNQPIVDAEQHNNQAQNIMTREQLKVFFTHMPPGDREMFNAALDDIANSQWPNYIKMFNKLKLINIYSRDAIVAIASDVPAEQLSSFVNICDRILPSVYEEHTANAITKVATTEYTKWSALADIFDAVKDSIEISQRSNALADLAKISADKYGIIRDYCSLIQSMPGSTDPMQISNTGTDSNLILALIDTDVLTVLEKAPQLPDLLRALKDFARNIDPVYLKFTIRGLNKIPAEHWQNFVDACNLIVQTHKDLNYWNRGNIPSVVSKIKPIFLPYFIEFVRYSPNFFEKVTHEDFSYSMNNVTTLESFKAALDALRNKYLPDAPAFE